MKCLLKYQWVKLSRAYLPQGKGLMGYWAKLASRAAFRKGHALYAVNAVVKTPVALLQVESQWHKEWLQCPAIIRLEHKS